MTVRYYKRFRMEIDLVHAPQVGELPKGYYWIPWHESIVDQHADVKFRCFENELDATLFPCLGDQFGCKRLMREISVRRGFIPQATWLIGSRNGLVGTIQGVSDRRWVGMIQNVGVVREARGRGFGAALVLRALAGFREAGMRIGSLEVTAQNARALRLYRKLGFRKSRTVYKAVPTASASV